MEKIYHLGNATVTIVAPVITKEEKQKRLHDIESLIFNLLDDEKANEINKCVS